MCFREFIGVVIAICFFALRASAATMTVNGVPFFDMALGRLTRATVTVDPMIQDTSYTSQVVALDNHQHYVAFPSVQVGPREVVFPPVATSLGSAPALVLHNHSFDPPPSTVIFEGDDLNYFIFDGTFIHPHGIAFGTSKTLEPDSHYHFIDSFILNFSAEATTTFDYSPIQVPEPAALLLAVFGAALIAGRSYGANTGGTSPLVR